MPELPEVETVRRNLTAAMVGARFERVECRRADLRFPLPERFSDRLQGARIEALNRRGKYLVAPLSSGESLVMHLGMSGRFSTEGAQRLRPGGVYFDSAPIAAHDHVVFDMRAGNERVRIIYNDPRRFGFMDLIATESVSQSRHFEGMGPEPLSEDFTPAALISALHGKKAPIKSALLDQSVVAGLGNIYVCEALYRAGVSPRRSAGSISAARVRRLHPEIIGVLQAAIAAGGSTLKDYAAPDGAAGGFQERFAVYDRSGEPCGRCRRPIRRVVQSGRATFFCGTCQR
jgi:formamidopyrimidine-DNA glycosylase